MRRIDSALLARAVEMVRGGASFEEAAVFAGCSVHTVRREMRRAGDPLMAQPRPPAPDDAGDDLPTMAPIDPSADPLDIMRALLASATDTIAKLRADSPRLNPARAEARALTKAIAALEKERSGAETPEELERRRRREDAETRSEIEQYVLRAEREAAAKGVCVHCGQAVLR